MQSTNVIAEYKMGKSVYQIRHDGFVDNINVNLPGVEVVYPWNRIYATLEYEKVLNPATRMPEQAIRWMRVYLKGGQKIAEMSINNEIRPSMVRFFEVFKATQDDVLKNEMPATES